MNNDLVIVNITSMTIWNFAKDKKEAKESLIKANLVRHEDIRIWNELFNNYPNIEQYKEYLEEAKKSKYKIMTYDKFYKMSSKLINKNKI
jgi:hypothetical protein